MREAVSRSKSGIGSTWSPGEVSLGKEKAKGGVCAGEPRQLFLRDEFRGRQTRGLGGARLRSATPAPGLAPGPPGGCWWTLYVTATSGPVRSPKILTGPCGVSGGSGAASREVTESRRGSRELGTRCNLEGRFAVCPPQPFGSSEAPLGLTPLSSLLAGDPLRFQ